MASKPEISGASVTNEKNATAEDILNEMNAVWNEARQIWAGRGVTQDATGELDRIYEDIRGRHKELYSSYPTVLRHMLQEMRYSPDAFEKYLRRLKVRPWLNDDQRMDSYADYWVLLNKSITPRYNPKDMQVIRADYRNRLQEEHDKFRSRFEKCKRDVEAEEKEIDNERREHIRKIAERLAAMQRNEDALKSLQVSSPAAPPSSPVG